MGTTVGIDDENSHTQDFSSVLLLDPVVFTSVKLLIGMEIILKQSMGGIGLRGKSQRCSNDDSTQLLPTKLRDPPCHGFQNVVSSRALFTHLEVVRLAPAWCTDIILFKRTTI